MKTNLRRIVLPAAVLGGILLPAGCSTPTVTVGAPTTSNRFVISVSSPVPTTVQCAWQQDGALIQHQNTTPFRLMMPCDSVHEISFTKPAKAAVVAVEIRSPAAKPGRFVMERSSSGLRLVRVGWWWGPFEQGS